MKKKKKDYFSYIKSLTAEFANRSFLRVIMHKNHVIMLGNLIFITQNVLEIYFGEKFHLGEQALLVVEYNLTSSLIV